MIGIAALVAALTWAIRLSRIRALWRLPSKNGEGWFLAQRVGPGFYDGEAGRRLHALDHAPGDFHAEMIELLGRVPDLRVPARTSSFYFKGKAEDIGTSPVSCTSHTCSKAVSVSQASACASRRS